MPSRDCIILDGWELKGEGGREEGVRGRRSRSRRCVSRPLGGRSLSKEGPESKREGRGGETGREITTSDARRGDTLDGW